MGDLGSQPIQHLAMSTPVDNAPVTGLSAANSLGLMPDIVPPVIGPKVINTDSRVGSGEIPSLSGKTNAPDPFDLAAGQGNRLPDQPNYLCGPDSWDNLYANAHGVMKSAWDKNWNNLYFDAHGAMESAWDKSWDNLYFDAHGVVESAWDKSWDNLYFDAHGVMESAWDKSWDNLYIDAHGVVESAWDKSWDNLYIDANGMKSAWDMRWETPKDNVPSPPQNDLNHARGFPATPVGSLKSIIPAYTSSHDARC